ncbi:uncharacterized protein LOC136088061 [Hydra vulgaris]|uniref:Uncharacterized protein LOC136088061 n=1 Tax=Hydra vulgaris TaxID=6087 RepID=A0ABM4D0L8_HYDVU
MDNFFDISSPNRKEYVKKTRSNLNAEEDILWFSTLKSGVKTGGLGGKDNLLKLSVKRKIEKEEKEKLRIDKEKKRKLNDKEIDFSVYKSDSDSTEESFFAASRGSMYSDSQSSSKIDYEVNNFESSAGVMENVVSDNINLILPRNFVCHPMITATADRCKLSNAQLMMNVSAILVLGGVKANDVDISLNTIRRARKQNRQIMARNIMA